MNTAQLDKIQQSQKFFDDPPAGKIPQITYHPSDPFGQLVTIDPPQCNSPTSSNTSSTNSSMASHTPSHSLDAIAPPHLSHCSSPLKMYLDLPTLPWEGPFEPPPLAIMGETGGVRTHPRLLGREVCAYLQPHRTWVWLLFHYPLPWYGGSIPTPIDQLPGPPTPTYTPTIHLNGGLPGSRRRPGPGRTTRIPNRRHDQPSAEQQLPSLFILLTYGGKTTQ